MGSWGDKPYELLWEHEDGNLYSCLKVPYEGESKLVRVYKNGFTMNADLAEIVMGDW